MKMLVRIGVMLLVIVGIGIALLYGVGFLLSPQDALERSDVIVAVSGGETQARAAEAVRLYRDGKAPVILFSGAALDPESPSNALVMRNQAIAMGVPAEAILVEERSKNTNQNALETAPILRELGAQQIILVTSPYHQRRTSIVFRRMLGKGVRVLNHSAPDQNWRRNHWWATPYSRDLTISEVQKVLYIMAGGPSVSSNR